MGDEADRRLLDQLLRPRLGYAMDPWPRVALDGLRQFAAEEKVDTVTLSGFLLKAPDDARWSRLIALATIGHTCFFRHPEQLARLRDELLAWDSPGPVWVWCAGCATGEEAYSVALASEDCEVEVRVVATDVDQEALAFARRGHYPPSRAGSMPSAKAGKAWNAPEPLRRRIRFEHASLTEAPPSPGRFHYIFCRNVLVYFGQRQLTVLQRLASALTTRGSLVISPTEALGALPATLRRDQPLGWLHPASSRIGRESVRPRASERPAPAVPRAAEPHGPAQAAPAPNDPHQQAVLASAQGDLTTAEQTLRTALDTDPGDALSWFLLGEVLVQRGELSQADVAFGRAETLPVDPTGHVDEDTLHGAARRRRHSLKRG